MSLSRRGSGARRGVLESGTSGHGELGELVAGTEVPLTSPDPRTAPSPRTP
jgi:hypothetical protein